MKKAYISSETTGAPLSAAYEVNGIVFVSGQIHMNAAKELEGNTIEEKLAVTMSNIKRILGETGLQLEDVVRVQLYLTDLDELPALNKAYMDYFQHPLPARTAIGVVKLPLGASLEIDVVAVRS